MTSFLLAWILQASIVAAAASGVAVAGRRRSPRARHAVLSVGLASFLLPPLVPLPSLPGLLGIQDATGGARLLELAVPSGALRLLAVLWVAGTGLLAAVIVAQAAYLVRLRREARRHDRGTLQLTVGRIARELGLVAVPHVFVSDRIPAPFACGIFVPAILVPAETVRRLTPRHIELVLAHELAHVRQGDLWLNAVRALICALWWPHPLAWIVGRLSRQVREEACDDIVLTDLGVAPRDYARSLVDSAAATTAWRRAPLLAVGASAGATLPGRLERLFDPQARRSRRLTWPQRVAVVAFAAVAWSGATIDVRPGPAPSGGTLFMHVGGSPGPRAHFDHGGHARHFRH